MAGANWSVKGSVATVASMGDFRLLFAAAGFLIFGSWLALEVWLRLAPAENVPFIDKQVRTGESSYYRVRVRVPSGYRIDEKWVWISAKQYASLEGAHELPVHVRRSRERTMVRGVHHRARLWLIGFMVLYFGINLIVAFGER
jgi:hypothetical protein